MRHVIIGNGPAGVVAAETIRKNAPDDEIFLIGDEPEPPYSRMAIPQLLAGEITEAGSYLRREPEYFDRLRITLKNARVAHVSTRTRFVKMEDGSAESFDKLLIAAGASPRVPPIPGIELPGVHACWTLEDARKILSQVQPHARVVLIGAGFIGTILMEALVKRGVELTVVEKKDHMLPGMMSKAAGDMIQRWCERKGVRVLTSARVTAIGGTWGVSTAPYSVRLADGKPLLADLVVYSVGSVPNTGFLRGSGIRCLRGVVIDSMMQTNVPGVYAAGDCAEAFDNVAGRSIIAGVQPNAADQAYCAALNMTGRHAVQQGVRQIDVLDTMGLIASSFGQWHGVLGGQWVEVADERHFKYLRLEFRKEVLIGCNVIGVTEHSGILRALIQNRVRLGPWKDRLLQDPTLLKEAYADCMQDEYVHHASAFYNPAAQWSGPGRPVM